MKTLKPLLAAAVAATLLGTALAQSQMPPPPDRPMRGMGDGMDHGMERGGPMNPERPYEGLDLADAQRAQLHALADDHRRIVEPLRERMRAARQTLADAKPGDADYDAKTAAARKELDDIRDQMRAAHESFRSRADALLTPEQRNQVESRRAEMRDRMRDRMRERTGERRGERGGMRGPGDRQGHGGHSDGAGVRPRPGS